MSLKEQVVRLAYQQPSLRDSLLPLLTAPTSPTRQAAIRPGTRDIIEDEQPSEMIVYSLGKKVLVTETELREGLQKAPKIWQYAAQHWLKKFDNKDMHWEGEWKQALDTVRAIEQLHAAGWHLITTTPRVISTSKSVAAAEAVWVKTVGRVLLSKNAKPEKSDVYFMYKRGEDLHWVIPVETVEQMEARIKKEWRASWSDTRETRSDNED